MPRPDVILRSTAQAFLLVSCNAFALADGPRILPVGDSITYGLTAAGYGDGGSTEIAGGYRATFLEEMTDAGLSFRFVGSSITNPSDALTAAGQARHEGHGGWTVGADVYSALDNFVYHIENWMASSNPDVVLLHGGTNDILLDSSPGKTAGNMDLLLGKIFTSKPTVNVFVSSIIPLTGGRSGHNPNVVAYNNAIANTLVPKYAGQGRSIYLVDQYAGFTSGGVPDGTHLPDGIHPDRAGYAIMGTTFAHAVATYAPMAPARTPLIIDVAASQQGNNLAGTVGGESIKYNGTWTNSITEMVDSAGNGSDYGFQWISYNGLAYLNSNAAGSTAGAAAAIFPDAVARSFWGSPAGNSINFKLIGLFPSTEYVLDFFAGHASGSDVTRFVLTGANTVTGDLRAGGNLSEILTLGGLLPSASGEISVSVTAAPGSDSLYFNAMRLSESVVPEPASLALPALASLALLRRSRMERRQTASACVVGIVRAGSSPTRPLYDL